MNTKSLLAAGVFGLIITAGAQAGVVNYSLHADMAEATQGDTVSLRVDAEIDPQGGAFYALAGATFNITTNDIPSGGTVNFTGPGLGLVPPFLIGSPGILFDDDIINVQAAQLPGFMNPSINTDTTVTLYRFEFTVDDDTPRIVTFNLTGLSSEIYASANPGPGSGLNYSNSTSGPLELQVTAVPAPGAVALLMGAGLISRRRRRTT